LLSPDNSIWSGSSNSKAGSLLHPIMFSLVIDFNETNSSLIVGESELNAEEKTNDVTSYDIINMDT
jgi:hypothetical protein